MNFHCSFTGRKGAREREERDGERKPRRGLYAGAGLARTARPRLLSAPPPISARQRLEGLGPRDRGPDWRQGEGVRDTGTEGGRSWDWVLETVLTVQRRRADSENRADEQVTFTSDSRGREKTLRCPSEARDAGSSGLTLLLSLAKPVGPR